MKNKNDWDAEEFPRFEKPFLLSSLPRMVEYEISLPVNFNVAELLEGNKKALATIAGLVDKNQASRKSCQYPVSAENAKEKGKYPKTAPKKLFTPTIIRIP